MKQGAVASRLAAISSPTLSPCPSSFPRLGVSGSHHAHMTCIDEDPQCLRVTHNS